ncbi:hypothetical protein N7510_008518 [Penicillium lagena]|uniref:uncharacterized protein n=1 Tax=Penicillium lagena TaxID=94218 RepID=UPI0025402E5A|nr:uncharacterized protein N7510_008518 [Penicillium lagena]KAJ5605737.1 hypothetical protein N7510_008518 [Penicillium lagena]
MDPGPRIRWGPRRGSQRRWLAVYLIPFKDYVANMTQSDADESTQLKQRVTTIVLAVLAVVFVALRLTARQMKGMAWGMDDYTLIVGLGFVVALAAVNLACVHYGMGRHGFTLSGAERLAMYKVEPMHQRASNGLTDSHGQLIFAFEPLYLAAIGTIKISVLLMYYRIFPVRTTKIGGYILGGITLAWMISVEFVAIFQCDPVASSYIPDLPGKCINLKAAMIGIGVPNFVTDIFILALPARLIWRLHASLWQRVSILLVFLSGSFVVFASVYRLTLMFNYEVTDIAWTLASTETWCVVESAAGVISACLPTLVPLFRSCTSAFVSTVRSSTKYGNSQSGTGAALAAESSNVERGWQRTGEGHYPLGPVGPGNSGSRSSHAQGKGWTMIGTDDNDSDW